MVAITIYICLHSNPISTGKGMKNLLLFTNYYCIIIWRAELTREFEYRQCGHIYAICSKQKTD